MVEARTLILTRSFQPHQIVSWEEAMVKLFNGKLGVVESYSSDSHVLTVIPRSRLREFPTVIRAYPSHVGGDLQVRVPSIARLTDWDGSVKRGVKFSRQNVFTRDQFRCQYCRLRADPGSLNYDHVLPRERGGKTVWENIVTSCYPCNSFKANRTPQEAGMTLHRQPFKPKTLPVHAPRFDPKEVLPSWIPYLGPQWVEEFGQDVA